MLISYDNGIIGAFVAPASGGITGAGHHCASFIRGGEQLRGFHLVTCPRGEKPLTRRTKITKVLVGLMMLVSTVFTTYTLLGHALVNEMNNAITKLLLSLIILYLMITKANEL